LAQTYGVDGSKLRWGLGGRSQGKLERVREDLESMVPGASKLPILTADSADLVSLKSMCKRTDVVITTVGPFTLYGEKLVQACVEEGSDYVDSTGETPFILKIIRMFQERAKSECVRVVPSCGYDSIPSDLGFLRLLRKVQEDNSAGVPQNVYHLIGPTRGGASGGTLESVMTIFSSSDKSLLLEAMSNPFSLVPRESAAGAKDSSEQKLPGYFAPAKVYTAPFIMAAANERYVRRSAAVLLGEKFRYFKFKEVMALRSAIKAFFVSFGIAVGAILLLLPPVRWLLKRFVFPAPGTGPSRAQRDKGYAMSFMHTKVDGIHYLVKTHISRGDPGYKSTGMMLAECGVVMAKSRHSAKAGGIYTVATCPGLGDSLFEPLAKNAGITFEAAKLEEKQLPSVVLPYDS